MIKYAFSETATTTRFIDKNHELGRRKVWMTPSPASSNLRETKRLSGKVGPD